VSYQIIKTESGTIEFDFQRFSGPLVVLVPAAGRGASDFNFLSSALVRAGYRTAAVNPRGAGCSQGPLSGLTLHDLAVDLAQIIEWCQGAPAAIIGHAFGNRLARCLASDRPDLVCCLVLLAAGGKIPPSADFLKAQAILRSGEASQSQRREATKAAYFAKNSEPDFWLLGNWPQALRAQSQAARVTPLEDWWAGGKCPILIIQGLEDICALPANGRKLKEDFGERVRLEEIPDAAHALLPEQPGIIAGLIINYLEQEFFQR
jgi:pimeloyl-ACP methyl ester carboxylesterase